MDKLFDSLGWICAITMIFSVLIWYGVLKIDKQQEQELILNYEKHPENYQEKFFGYIEFPKYRESRMIEYGNPNQVVESTHIGILGEAPAQISSGTLILVGHSRRNQFAILHQLQKGDDIVVIHDKTHYHYQVKQLEVIDENNLSFLNQLQENKLILITCMDDNEKRLIVVC